MLDEAWKFTTEMFYFFSVHETQWSSASVESNASKPVRPMRIPLFPDETLIERPGSTDPTMGVSSLNGEGTLPCR